MITSTHPECAVADTEGLRERLAGAVRGQVIDDDRRRQLVARRKRSPPRAVPGYGHAGPEPDTAVTASICDSCSTQVMSSGAAFGAFAMVAATTAESPSLVTTDTRKR